MELSPIERELIDLYNPSTPLTTRDLDYSNPTNYLQRGQYLEDQILFFLSSRPTYFRSEVYLAIAIAGISYAEK